eukprot:9266265-Karenia_brevis.AAC.1
MALAGSYRVTRNGKEVLFCPLEPLLEHLSKIEAYIVKHSSGADGHASFSDRDILASIRNIDESIRGEWARILRANSPEGITAGE